MGVINTFALLHIYIYWIVSESAPRNNINSYPHPFPIVQLVQKENNGPQAVVSWITWHACDTHMTCSNSCHVHKFYNQVLPQLLFFLHIISIITHTQIVSVHVLRIYNYYGYDSGLIHSIWLHCSCFKKKKKKSHANQQSPYENTIIAERDRENDYITMKPARSSSSAVGLPLPSTPFSVTSPVMTSVVSPTSGTPAVHLEVANVWIA